MKTLIKIFAVIIVLGTSSAINPQPASAAQGYVSFQAFCDQLSPFGQWVSYPNYGYVWIPDAGRDFVPYSSDGHWVYTDYGWTWVSDYDWGWATFHYGRWDYDNYYGWFWVPGYEWGPAWVNWRRADGYYGWAPLAPGVSISLSFGVDYHIRNDRWIFVRDRDIDRYDINHYYIDRRDNDRIINRSRVINNVYVDHDRRTTYVTGPDRMDVQRSIGRRVEPIAVRENNRPGQSLNNGQLSIYRPQVQRNENHRYTPPRVNGISTARAGNERTGTPNNFNSSKEQFRNNSNQPAYNGVRKQYYNNANPQNSNNNINSHRNMNQQNNNRQVPQHNNSRPQNNNREQNKNTNRNDDNGRRK